MVDAFLLAHEHDLEFLTIGVVVNVLGQFLVNGIALHRNVDRNSRLEIDDVLAQSFSLVVQLAYFLLVVLQLLQHVNLILFRLVETLLKLSNVLRRTLKLLLQFGLGLLHVVMMSFPGGQLFLHVVLLGQTRIQLEHGTLQADNSLLALSETQLELVDLEFVLASILF